MLECIYYTGNSTYENTLLHLFLHLFLYIQNKSSEDILKCLEWWCFYRIFLTYQELLELSYPTLISYILLRLFWGLLLFLWRRRLFPLRHLQATYLFWINLVSLVITVQIVWLCHFVFSLLFLCERVISFKCVTIAGFSINNFPTTLSI